MFGSVGSNRIWAEALLSQDWYGEVLKSLNATEIPKQHREQLAAMVAEDVEQALREMCDDVD